MSRSNGAFTVSAWLRSRHVERDEAESVSATLPIRHLSIRVPWHDGGWDGTVCRNPKGNAACLVLKEIRDTRNDELEQSLAGRSIDTLDQSTQWPACMGERATFMAPFELTRMVK